MITNRLEVLQFIKSKEKSPEEKLPLSALKTHFFRFINAEEVINELFEEEYIIFDESSHFVTLSKKGISL